MRFDRFLNNRPLAARRAYSLYLSALGFTISFSISVSAFQAFAQAPVRPPILPPQAIDAADNSSGDESIAKDSGTEINVKNAEISAIVKIFSKKTKRNYILDERVKGKVSIYLPGKVSTDESLRILDSVLAFKGFTSVPISENLWKIVPSKDARQSTIPTVEGEGNENPSAAVVTRLLPLKFVSADEVKQLISQLISPDGLINAYTGTNSLIIIDSEDNISRLEKIVTSLDVPFSDREMTIIPIVYADAPDIAQKLNDILNEKSSEAGADSSDIGRARLGNQAGRPGTQFNAINMPPIPGQPINLAPPSAVSTTTVTSRAREPKIIADERTNSIILVADDDTTARIRALISQLDSKIDLSGNKFYVYRCQHANADELANTLSGLAGGGGSSSNSRTSGDSDVANTLSGSSSSSSSRGRSSKNSRTKDRIAGQTRTPGQSRLNKGNKSSGGVNLGEDISISADASTNSLIISASKTDYQKILQLLEKLDVKRRQVLVEAMLLEVGVDENETSGVDFISSAGGKDGGILAQSQSNQDLVSLLKDPSKLSGFSVAAASSGSLKLPGNITIPTQAILLSAAKTNTNVNVLSAPTILATDNEQAEIVVGQNVPFISSTATSDTNLNNTFNQIDRQDVGITLRITPQISSGESVKLSIFTEVSDLVSESSLGPKTTIRTSETTVIAKDGQMIVTGGLMSDSIGSSDNGVPYLKDVPIFGHFFRNNTDTRRRTNLLIFITPRVIKDQFDARDATTVQRQKMEDVIASNEVYPNRQEVLRNPDIDRIAEAKAYSGPKPGTIIGRREPAASNRRPPLIVEEAPSNSFIDQPAVNLNKNQEKENTKDSQQKVIELRVAPKLPEIPKNHDIQSKDRESPDDEIEDSQDSGLKSEVKSRLKPVTDNEFSGTFVVLQLAHPQVIQPELPFASGEEQRVVGIVLPGESGASTRKFFDVGQTLSYGDSKSGLKMTTVAVFNSPQEAQQMYQELAGTTWYNLSPYEIMNLGTGPWLKEKAAQ